jgi:hypothetical protein
MRNQIRLNDAQNNEAQTNKTWAKRSTLTRKQFLVMLRAQAAIVATCCRLGRGPLDSVGHKASGKGI